MTRTYKTHLQGITLSEALNLLTVDRLKELIDLLTGATRPTRKAEIIAVLRRRLAGKSLAKLWHELDETQRLAVSETLYGPDGAFVETRFRAKYGVMPAFDTPASRRGYRAARPTLLRLFLYPADRYDSGATVIPGELQERLRAFVPHPEAPALPAREDLPETAAEDEKHSGQSGEDNGEETATTGRSVDRRSRRASPIQAATLQAPLVRRGMERAAQQDLLTVLRLIERGKVAVSATTRQASAAAVRNVAAILCDGDFYDPAPQKKHAGVQTVGPLRAFAWPWLVQAANLAERRGNRLALTKAGRAALSAPPADTLRRLWQRWLGTTLLDEFSRIDAIKGQRGRARRTMTAASSRRAAIAEALKECPVGLWVRTGDFSRFMQASGDFDFDITHDPWKLYIAEAHYGSLGYDGYHGWNILQERYLLCLLFEYAATLGLIDVAYSDPHGARWDYLDLWGADDLDFLSRYDGLHYFRVNPLGAYCLGIAKTYEPKTPPARASLTVLPNLRLKVMEIPLSGEEKLLLETYATAESEEVWCLDRDKTLSAIESGHPANELRDFLTARDDQPLPETVEGFLRDTLRRARALMPQGTALLIECADADLATLLASHASTAKLCLRAGERHLAVKAKSEDTFRKAVHKMGYGMPRG